jgi:hypothetical protein
MSSIALQLLSVGPPVSYKLTGREPKLLTGQSKL